ncbi:MAG: cell division protein FtsZ [Candidatus Nealsonbacteria bacterium]|nr:MAG: cell division protein FtsZ [Candidatus Nealsonbacteria bacterium]
MRKKKKKPSASWRKKRVSRRKTFKKRKELKKSEPKDIKKIKVRVIGIGGGGGSIVSEIAQRVKGASFFAANTDLKALGRFSRKVKKFYFGENLTHGLGTGMNPEIGEEAAKNEKERIKKIMEGQDFVILVACLGGGLGSGAAPVFANISKNLGNLTYGIFTFPFKFEGEKKMGIAKDSLEILKTKLDALSIIPNERIFQIIERTAPLKKALSTINKSLSDSLQSLIEIIYKPGLINIDFADLRTIFKEKGTLAYLNSIEIGKEKEKEAIDKVINSPLYPYSIDGAKGVLFNISGQKDLSLAQVNQISKTIAKKVYRTAKIIFGISGTKKSSKIRISLLATGCSSKIFFRKPTKKPKKIQADKSKKRKLKPKKKKIEEIVSEPPKPPKQPVSLKKKPIRRLAEKKPKKKKKKEKKRVKVRRNALEVRKGIEQEEAEIISKEKVWETPTFLRKKMTQG